MPAADCIAAARAIAQDLVEIEHREHSLAGTAGALLLCDVLGDEVAVPVETIRRWEAAIVASIESDLASFTDGMLGSAWLLARRPGRSHHVLLAAIDDAVLDALADRTWPGALGVDRGGLAGFALYGLSRRTRGRAIVDRCVAHLEKLASRQHRWLPGLGALPTGRGAIRLLNMEGSAAAIAVLAAASGTVPRARALARAGALTLVADLEGSSNRGIGEWTPSATLGVVHGTATWSLGGAGVGAALGAVARIGGRRDQGAALRFGRGLAAVPPEACKTTDASLGGGTAGLAIVLDALAEQTRDPMIRSAADYWFLRTLRCRSASGGIGGYRFIGGGSWAPRTGLYDGAVGTALALLVAAGHSRARVCRTMLGVS